MDEGGVEYLKRRMEGGDVRRERMERRRGEKIYSYEKLTLWNVKED